MLSALSARASHTLYYTLYTMEYADNPTASERTCDICGGGVLRRFAASMLAVTDHARWYVEQVIVPTARRRAIAKLKKRQIKGKPPQVRQGHLTHPVVAATAVPAAASDRWAWVHSALWLGAVCLLAMLLVRCRRQLRAWGAYVLAPSAPPYVLA